MAESGPTRTPVAEAPVPASKLAANLTTHDGIEVVTVWAGSSTDRSYGSVIATILCRVRELSRKLGGTPSKTVVMATALGKNPACRGHHER